MNLSKDRIILILTKQCQKNCPHCFVRKTTEKMTLETARKAVSFFINGPKKRFLVRLLGGEPLLNLPVAKKIISFGIKEYPELKFDLTTNGALLDKKNIDFFQASKNTELIISSYQTDKKCLERLLFGLDNLSFLTININLLPQKLKTIVKLFDALIKIGIRNFNFLPAFYFSWKRKEISELENVLKEIYLITKNNSAKIRVKNLEYSSLAPLYNFAPTIDCQGDVYAGDFFLDIRFESLKRILYLGNIYKLKSAKEIFDMPLSIDINALLENVFSGEILRQTKEVNKKLADFCELMRKTRKKSY